MIKDRDIEQIVNEADEELNMINNMFVDVSYMQMLNGFNELDRDSLIETVKDIWRFVVVVKTCLISEYSHFMNIEIGSRFNNLKCVHYNKYGMQLKKEMIEWLNKKFVIAKVNQNDKTVELKPNYKYKAIQMLPDKKHTYNILKNVDIYADNKEIDDATKSVYVETCKEVYKEHEDSYKRTFGYKYSDVENWSYEQWTHFMYEYKKDGHKMPILLKHNTEKKPVGRPKGQHIIKMIDVETGEVFERFNCRQDVIDMIGIKKSNLAQCLKASKTNPNAKSTWRKYKYEDRKYWFVEEKVN